MSTRPSPAAQSPQRLEAVVRLTGDTRGTSRPGGGVMHGALSRMQGVALGTTLRLGVAALLGGLLCGCGGGVKRPTPETTNQSDGAPTKAKIKLPGAGEFFTAGRTTYSGADALGELAAEQSVVNALGQTLRPPPALSCAAREYAARFAADQRPPRSAVVKALSAHCGLWANPAFSHAVTGQDATLVVDHLKKVIEAKSLQGVGVGVVDGPAEGQVTAAILALPGDLRIEQVPRQINVGQQIEVKGRLFRGAGPLLALAGPMEGGAGAITEIPVTVSNDGAFELSWKIPEGAFAKQPYVDVELLRQQGKFLNPVGILRLRAQPEAGYSAEVNASAEGAVDPGKFRAQFIEALNTRRRSKGLGPLADEGHLAPLLDDWLARLGAGQDTLDPPQVTDNTGQPFSKVQFTFASGGTGAEALSLLIDRPHGQRALLGAGDHALAVGVRPYPGGGGADAVVLTLTRFTAEGIPAARGKLMERLNADRVARGVKALTANQGLQDAAQSIAEGVLSGQVKWPTVIDVVMQKAGPAGASGAVGAGAFTLDNSAAGHFLQEPNAMAPQVAHVGIGVASGPLPGGGPPKLVVIYIVSEAIAER
ncbi:MAG: hypothetical protein ACE366_05570 [Bradymonadia bacterium]